jgi:diamine N-acetyltransferase
MNRLTGKHIYLRSLDPVDLDFLQRIENDEQFWPLSGTVAPYSKDSLISYISNARQSLEVAGQYRYVICDTTDCPVGFIDLFDYNHRLKKAGVGLIIAPEFQGKGYGSAALERLITYAFDDLHLQTLFANILANNTVSINLFSKHNFKKIAVQKKHMHSENMYIDQLLFQLTAR